MRRTTALLAVTALLLAACTGGGTPAPGADSGDDAWRSVALTDVLTGETFSIDGLRGKVVAIEAMAVWCSTCRIQQGEARSALEQLASPDVVYISLDVDPNEREALLADYARQEGFEWRFAVAPPEMTRSLAATFGPQILSPPSTPLVVLDPQGDVVAQHIGITFADDMAALISEHLP